MAKRRSRRHRRHHSGMGSAISLRGLGKVKSSRGIMSFVLPTAVGVLVPAAVIASARYFAKPAESETQASIYKNAPWLGLGAGLVSAGALYFMSRGAAAPLAATVAATGVALTSYVHDQIVIGSGNDSFLIPNMATRRAAEEARAATPPAPPPTPDTAPAAGLGSYFTQRPNGALGAAVPQLNGVVMSPTNGLGYSAYTGGETVNLGAVNSSAFGTPGFRP
jgi:hypothetical protein